MTLVSLLPKSLQLTNLPSCPGTLPQARTSHSGSSVSYVSHRNVSYYARTHVCQGTAEPLGALR